MLRSLFCVHVPCAMLLSLCTTKNTTNETYTKQQRQHELNELPRGADHPKPTVAEVKSTFTYVPTVKHLKGQSVNIFGMNRANRGHHCEEHAICCHTLEENSLVCIRREVFATKDKGKIVEQAGLSIYSVDMGVDRCRVGFLPHACVQTGTLFDGVLCQVSIFFLMHCIIRLLLSTG